MHTKDNGELEDSYDAGEGMINEPDGKQNMKKSEKNPASQQSLLKNWPLMSSIIVYCVFQLHDMAYTEVIFSSRI